LSPFINSPNHLELKDTNPYFYTTQLTFSPPYRCAHSGLGNSHPPFNLLSEAYTHSRHWAVLVGSLATVLTSWGLTPVQAGIFATSTVNVTNNVSMMRSTTYLAVSQQASSLSAQSAYSVANILWLNETLPPYMNREFIVTPFGLLDKTEKPSASITESWTSTSVRYGVNITCEEPMKWRNQILNETYLNSTWGCSIPIVQPGLGFNDSEPYSGAYIGWSDTDGSADYSLSSGYCPSNESHSFLIQWAKVLVSADTYRNMLVDERELNLNVTRQWCRSVYYSQNISISVSIPKAEILHWTAIDSPKALPVDLFNTTEFEAAMNMGHAIVETRTDFPTSEWPDQTAFLFNMSIFLTQLLTMMAFAIGSTQMKAEDYLNSSLLIESYQSAYRLLFARQMRNVISSQLDTGTKSSGQKHVVTQAIVVVSVFAYLAQGLLACTILAALCLWFYCASRPLSIHEDPSTIAQTMELSANDPKLLEVFKHHDGSTEQTLKSEFSKCEFRLEIDDAEQPSIQLLRGNSLDLLKEKQIIEQSNDIRGILPREFKLLTGTVFVVILSGLIVLLPVLYFQASNRNGVSLIMSSRHAPSFYTGSNLFHRSTITFTKPIYSTISSKLPPNRSRYTY
jgi:hypothetical protein